MNSHTEGATHAVARALNAAGLFLLILILCSYTATAESQIASTDVGDTGTRGSSTLENNTYTVTGAGGSNQAGGDTFHFVHAALTGNGQVVARFRQVQNTHEGGWAGVMLLEELNPDAKHVALLLHPEIGASTRHVSTAGDQTITEVDHDVFAPYWLKITRKNDVIKTFTSMNGLCWKEQSSIHTSMNETAYFGVAVSSIAQGEPTKAEVDSFRINSIITGNATGCLPSGFITADVGAADGPGSTTEIDGQFEVNAAGRSIGGKLDAFHFAFSVLLGDGQITARLAHNAGTRIQAKAGIMIRDDLAAGAANAMLLVHPKKFKMAGFQFRPTRHGPTTIEDPGNLEYFQAPLWLRLVRMGDTIAAYVSQDGLCWLPRREQTLSHLDETTLVGLAVSSGEPGVHASASFTDVEVTHQITPFNAQCERARIDIDLPEPDNWVVAPGYSSNLARWSISTANPNGTVTPDRCPIPQSENYGIGKTRVAYRTGPDDPDCSRSVMPIGNWTWPMPYADHGRWSAILLPAGNTDNLPGGIADTRPTKIREVRSTVEPGDQSSLWFRRTFNLSTESQRQGLMFWGRWTEGISVYINGIRASHFLEEGYPPDSYRYLGLSDEARASLNLGENVITVRVEADGSSNIFFDMGITVNNKLASLPMVQNNTNSSPPPWARFDQALKEALQEQGIPAGTMALRHDATRISTSFGYLNKALTDTVKANSIFRLASVDKPLTKVLIRQIMSDPNYNNQPEFAGALTADRRYFEVLKSKGFPMHENELGKQVKDVTIQQLMDHRSGIAGVAGGSHIEGQYHFSYLGIPRAEWDAEDMAKAILMHDNNFEPGTDKAYSNDGYFLLRYLAEKIIEPMSIEDYFRTELLADSSNKSVVIAYEDHMHRRANEPGYMTRILPADRFIGFEEYRALSSSADAFLYMADSYNFNTGETITEGTASAAGGVTAGSRAAWKQRVDDHWNFSYFIALNVSYDHLKYFDELYADFVFDLQYDCTKRAGLDNLINNCNFAKDLVSWSLVGTNNAQGDLLNNRRAALVEITGHGLAPEDLRLSQTIKRPVSAGEYRLKFKSRVAGPADIPLHALEDDKQLKRFEHDAMRYIRVKAVNQDSDIGDSAAYLSSDVHQNIYMPTGPEYHEVTFRVNRNIPENKLRIDFELGRHDLNAVSQPAAFYLDAVSLERIGH